MKIKLLVVALMAVVVGFGACGGKKNEDSSEKAILTFKVNGITYNVNESTKTISYEYPKTAENTWTGIPSGAVIPEVTVSPNADYAPKTAQNFLDGSVVYTVTAEDGSTQTYTVRAQRGSL